MPKKLRLNKPENEFTLKKGNKLMNKKHSLLLLLLSASTNAEDQNSHQLIRTHGTHYLIPFQSRQITLYNSTTGAILARYQRPDPGFGGPHVLVEEQEVINSAAARLITLLKNAQSSSFFTITQQGQRITGTVSTDDAQVTVRKTPGGAALSHSRGTATRTAS